MPIILPPGYILVYGDFQQSYSGVVPGDTSWRFGTVYQIWDGGTTYVYGGDPVMYKNTDVEVKLATGNEPFQYQMIKARLVTKDIITP